MKLNNKGFAASGVIYSLLILFLAVILSIMTMLSNRKMILDKLKSDVLGNVEEINIFKNYETGQSVYFNPIKNQICFNYVENNSLTGYNGTEDTKTADDQNGCLKFYAFNDSENSDKVNLILDHNTTTAIAYNSTGSNSEMTTIATALSSDTSNWAEITNPRLITAEEIAQITNNTEFNGATSTLDKTFYFETNSETPPTPYQGTYSWLYDYTDGCTIYGCNIEDSSTTGYWTSTPVADDNVSAWVVDASGYLGYDNTDYDFDNFGIRPVIVVDKNKLDKTNIGPTKIDATSTDTYKAIIYLDPTDLTKKCNASEYANNLENYDTTNLLSDGSKSPTGLKTGCMKWYVYEDDGTNYTMILDHNTTVSVEYNSTGSNSEMKEAATQLSSDTSNWLGVNEINKTIDNFDYTGYRARLITADEIANIIQKNDFDSTQMSSYFYLETKSTVQPNSYNRTYAWLYDYTKDCTSYGCNISDSSSPYTYGYWTSTPVSADKLRVWRITLYGELYYRTDSSDGGYGLRPVITISKDLFS